jgi:hypothetical protein
MRLFICRVHDVDVAVIVLRGYQEELFVNAHDGTNKLLLDVRIVLLPDTSVDVVFMADSQEKCLKII